FAAAEQPTFDGFPSISVSAGDLLFLRLSSRTPVDSSRVVWTPTVSYQGATDPATALDAKVRSQSAEVAAIIPRLLPANDPTRSWTATSTGNQTFSISCKDSVSGTLYLQGVNRLLAAQPLSGKSLDVHGNASAGEPLFVTLLTDGEVSASNCSVNGGAVPLNLRRPAADSPANVLSGGYHGWFYGDWNGNVVFNPQHLVPPQSKDDKPDFVAGAPHWEGVDGFRQPVWTASGFDLYMAAEGVKPSRKGANVAGVLDQSSGAASGGGLSVLRKTSGKTAGIGAGKPAAVLSTLPSVGSTISLSQTTSDLIDVNGDGLPDRVSMDPGSSTVTVQLNLGYRFGAPERWTLPALSASGHCTDIIDYVSSQLGALSGLDTPNSLSFTRSSALQGGVAIGPFGGGASTTLSRTEVELADINGDGLPDRVFKDERDGFFRVQLNLGDHWDSEQRWYVPKWSASIGDGYNLGFQCLDAISFSGHVEVDGSVGVPLCIPLVPPTPVVGLQIEISAQGFGSLNSGLQLFLEDIDGDGLPDHVLKKGGDPNVYVKRNQAGRVNLLSAMHRPLGSTIQISYQRRGNRPDMPFSQWVLSDVSVADGRG